MKTPKIRCHCGRRIVERDVLQRHWYVRHFRPTFMFLRFRCAHCKRIGEKLIDHEQWSEAILREVPTEMAAAEQLRVHHLGGISIEEQVDFHFALQADDALSTLPAVAELPTAAQESHRERAPHRSRANVLRRDSDARPADG